MVNAHPGYITELKTLLNNSCGTAQTVGSEANPDQRTNQLQAS